MRSLFLVFSMFAMTMLYSCGGSNSNGSAASSTSPLTQNGITSSAAGQFTGSWSGYLDNSYTTITIAPNGNITISAVGQSDAQRLLVLQNGNYYIVNPKANTGVPARISGNVLIVTINGVGETFNKKN